VRRVAEREGETVRVEGRGGRSEERERLRSGRREESSESRGVRRENGGGTERRKSWRRDRVKRE